MMLEDIRGADTSITAKSLLSYLDYIFHKRYEIEPARFATVANLFYDKQYEMLTHLEQKIETL